MAGAGGTEVGRISVKVVPDTEHFRGQLKRDLQKIEKSMRGTIGLDADLNTKGAVSQMRATMAALRAQAARGVNIDVGLDQKGGFGALKQSFRDFTAGLKDTGKAVNDARTGVRDYWREIQKMANEYQRQSPLMARNWAQLKAHNVMLQRGKSNVRDFVDALRTQQQWLRQSDPDLSANAARWKSWSMAIRDANVNATNGFRKFQSAIRNLGASGDPSRVGNAFTGLFKRIGTDASDASDNVDHVGKSFMGLSRMGWVVAAVFALAAPAIGLVAGLLAGLPSLISAFGAGATVVALGMDGIKAAAEGIAPQLEGLKAAVSSTFQQGLTPVFQQLAGIFPTITPGMQAVAQSLVNIASGFTNVVTSGKGLSQVNNILTQTSNFFNGLAPVISTATSSFLTLANAGANSFNLLLAPLQRFALQFDQMVQRVTSNGVFEGAMNGLSQTLEGVLSLFTRLMESGLQAMSSLGGPLNNLFSGVGDAIIALMPALTSLSGLLGNVLGELGRQLAPIITALTPAFQQLASSLGTVLTGALQSLGPALTQVASALGGAILGALQALQPHIPTLVQGFGQLITALGTGLSGAINALAPILPTLVTSFAQMSEAMLPTIISLFQTLAPLLPQIATVFTTLLNAILPLLPQLVQLVHGAIQPLIPALGQLIAASLPVAQTFADMLAAAAPLIGVLLQAAAAVLSFAAGLVGGAIGALAQVSAKFSEIIGVIGGWVTAFLDGATQFVSKAVEMTGQVISTLAKLGEEGLKAGINLVEGLINGIGNMIGKAVDTAKNLASSVAGAVTNFLGIHSPSKLMEGYGENTGQGFINGLESTKGQLVGSATDMMSTLRDVFSSGVPAAPVVADMQGLVDSVKQFNQQSKDAMAAAAAPLLAAGITSEDLQRADKMLGIRQKQLEQEAKLADLDAKNAKANKDEVAQAAAEARARELRAQKDQLGVQKDQLDMAKEYVGEVDKGGTKVQSWGDLLDKVLDASKGIAGTVKGQFLSDLGISGNGALPQFLEQGAGLLEQTIFNVLSVDDAMAVQKNEQNKKSLGLVGR